MKFPCFSQFGFPACLAAGLFALSTGMGAASVRADVPAATGTNAASQELSTPKAVFDITSSPVKDPFFPLSTRTAVVASATTNAPTISASSFQLKGLSGTSNQRLALINNRTMASGEFSEVTTPAGRIKIQLLEIKENSVLIRTESQTEPIELRFEERSRK
jgi:hypothetical protein